MRKLNFLSWFLILLVIVSIIGMFGNLSTYFFSENDSAFEGYQFWVSLLNSLLFWIGLFFAQRAIIQIKTQQSFTNKCTAYFDKSALFLLLSAFLNSIVVFSKYAASIPETSHLNLAFNFLQIILALFLFAITDIVSLGKNYQEENRLTI